MCILFVYTNPNPDPEGYRLIIATNRDEIFKRPACEAHIWKEDEHVIGGQDLEVGREGGTWFALSTRAIRYPSYLRVGALLNVTGEPRLLEGCGRGQIVADYVRSSQKAPDYMRDLAQHKNQFNAFNFIAIEIGNNVAKTYHYSNVDSGNGSREVLELDASKCLGFGNSLPESPFKKVEAGVDRFHDCVETYRNVGDKDKLVEELFYLLKWEDRHLPDAELEKRASQWQNYLSSIYFTITDAGYGTRAHTIVLVDDKGKIDFLEDSIQQPIQVEQPIWRLKKISTHL